MVKEKGKSSGRPQEIDMESAKVSVRKDKEKVGKKDGKSGEGKSRPSSAKPSVARGTSILDMDKSAKAAPAPAKKKAAPPPRNAYLGDMDLPPSDESGDEEQETDEGDVEEQPQPKAVGRSAGGPSAVMGFAGGSVLNLSVSDRELQKRKKKEQLLAQAQEVAKMEALKEDDNAFSVTMASSTRVAEDAEDDAPVAGPRDIKVEGFSVSAKGKELLHNASLTIAHGRRYGLVGPNGKGKSTILRLLARRQLPVPRNIDVLLVEQEVVGDDQSALEAVVAADDQLMKLREEETRLLALSEGAEPDEDEDEDEDGEASTAGDKGEETDFSEQLEQIYEKMRALGGDAAESRASKILAGLGFTPEMQKRPTKSFSGGWRMRVSLARALFMQPTLLMLDEPTNHLDLRAVIWLEEYLMRWKKTLIVVSHDRDFLNSVCTDIIHLHDEKLTLYRGNFATFEDMYDQKRRENNKKFENYEKQLKAAKRSGSKASADKVKDQAKFKASKDAKGKGKGKGGAGGGGDDDEGPADVPRRWNDYAVSFHFPEPTELTPPLLQLIDVSFAYPGRTDFGLTDIDAGIDMGTRVAIVGPNGAGKSTLLNLLAGDLRPTSGEARKSQKLRIGRYSQHFVDLLTMDETPVAYLLRLFPDQEGPSRQEAVRSRLGKFGLASHNHLTPIQKLSGGQKSRVVFTAISMSRPHILLLDEPTNHLDMQSIDALADALDEFTGGVILVSHDSRLISRVCDDEERSEIWVVENGTVERYDGSFEEYKKELIEEIVAEVEE